MARGGESLYNRETVASKVSDSRLGRLGKLVSLSGKVSGNLIARTASKLAGKDGAWAERRTARQLVKTLGSMKGLAQKLGQAMSMDIDHLPAEMRDIISALQSKSEPMAYEAIAAVVEEELGAPPLKLFASFERVPLAAASLGQVHRATLKDGTLVVVKVQYPGAASALAADLKNIDVLLRAAGGVMGAMGAQLKGQGYFDEVASELTLETDYVREARNCREFARLVQPFPELCVPQVFSEFSASRVLTLEYLAGEPLSDLLKRSSNESNARRFEVSRQLIAALFGPLLASGVVHADPHPGNFLLLPDGRLGLLDFGAIKRLSADFRDGNRAAFRALLDGVPPDFPALLRAAHFDVGAAPGEVAPLFSQFFRVLRQPVEGDHFDYATTQMRQQFEALARLHVSTLVKLKPPAEGLMLFRALGGQAQNLRAIGAAGNFRAAYASVFARALVGLPETQERPSAA